jgi:hypothetical protein
MKRALVGTVRLALGLAFWLVTPADAQEKPYFVTYSHDLERVLPWGRANTTDGDIEWFLRQDDLAHGMPSWSSLPGEQRWQLVAYLKSIQ